jgi:type II secretory pathway predicted ATPase ExeA
LYQEHYGLTALPFAESASADGFVALPSRESALHRLRYGLEYGRGPVLLAGPPGSGKTRLCSVLLRQVGWPVARIDVPLLGPDDLLAEVAEAITPASLGGRLERPRPPLRRIREALASEAARGGRWLLVVEDAHLIRDQETFEALGALQNFATLGVPDLSVVLVGGSELIFRLPPSLSDRLSARVVLGPLSEPEALPYLSGRLRFAGRSEPLFDAETASFLHLSADGLPRRLNRLADLSLLISYARGDSLPGPDSARLAARELAPDALAA